MRRPPLLLRRITATDFPVMDKDRYLCTASHIQCAIFVTDDVGFNMIDSFRVALHIQIPEIHDPIYGVFLVLQVIRIYHESLVVILQSDVPAGENQQICSDEDP